MKEAWNNILIRTYSVVSSDEKKHPHECSSNSPYYTKDNGFYDQKSFKCVIIISILGLVIFGSGILVLFFQPYDMLFKLKCVFTDGGEVFELWRKPPIELYLKVYLFNVTNRDAFLRGEEKLKVEEVGPYVYREHLSHENVTFNDNGTVSATPFHPLVWVPELSEGREEGDQLILPNIALLSIGQVVARGSAFTQFGLNLLIRQLDSQPLVQMSAREFMFGYESSLMSLGYQFLPNWISFDKLGLIDRMYDFDGDFETIFSGELGIDRTGLLDTYRGSKNLPQWEGKCANINNASDGTKFKSYIQRNDTLLFYRKSMCRTYNLVQVNSTTMSGLNGYVYNFEKNSNDNGKHEQKNSCYCKDGNCLPEGLVDVTGCYYGFPIATSFPHFLDAEPSVRDHVEGSHPDPKKHTSYFIIEPESGLPLKVAARFQINMIFDDLSSMANIERFSNMVLPMLWTEIEMQSLPRSLADRFNLYLNVLPVLEDVIMYLLFGLGILFLTIGIYKYIQKVKTLTNFSNTTWMNHHTEDAIHRKLSSYYHPEKRSSLTARELDIYFDSLVAPVNQELTINELEILKSGGV